MERAEEPPREEAQDYNESEVKKLEGVPQWSCVESAIERRDLVGEAGELAFVLYGFLDEAECKWLVEKGGQLGMAPASKQTSYRNNDRVVLESEALAQALFERLRPHLKPITITKEDSKMVGKAYKMEGLWEPRTLNERFRLCRYAPGGFFGPHYDGVFVRDASERSLQTFMIYLNDDFEGATTNFIDDSQGLWRDEQGRFRAEERNILQRLKPKRGMCLVFNHNQLHEGGVLESGEKWIFRSDIMYKRTRDDSALSETEKQALVYYQKAQKLESEGEYMPATELYAKAFKMNPKLEQELYGRSNSF